MTLNQFFKKLWALIVVMTMFIASILALVGALGAPNLSWVAIVYFFSVMIFHKQIAFYIGDQFETLSQ